MVFAVRSSSDSCPPDWDWPVLALDWDWLELVLDWDWLELALVLEEQPAVKAKNIQQIAQSAMMMDRFM